MRAFVIEGPRAASVHGGRGARRGGRPGRRGRRAGRRVRHRRRAVHRRDGLPPDGRCRYPLRIGHEWCGTVRAVGDGVDEAWVGRRVTGDTMLGCGRCRRCRRGRQHLCADRYEVGIRQRVAGRAGRAARGPGERRCTPLPDAVDDAAGRAGRAGRQRAGAPSRRPASRPGERLLVLGAGTIGLLVALMARARGRRGAPARAARGAARASPASLGLRARVAPRDPADAAVRRRGRRLQRRRAAGPRASTSSSPAAGSSGSASRGSPAPSTAGALVLKDVTVVGILSALAGPGRRPRAVRDGRRRSPAAGGRGRGARRGGGRPGGPPGSGLGRRPEGARRPPSLRRADRPRRPQRGPGSRRGGGYHA